MVDKNKIIKILGIFDSDELNYLFELILDMFQKDSMITNLNNKDKKREYHRQYYQNNEEQKAKARERYLKKKELKKKQVEDIFTDTDPEENKNNEIEV